MKTTVSLLTVLPALTLAWGMAASPAASAESIDVLMSDLFPRDEMTYIGFDSVEREDIPHSAGIDRKYLIVDFRTIQPQPQEEQLASVHRVCMALLKNRELIHSLSRQGYDMVSVAFDRNSQYDCL